MPDHIKHHFHAKIQLFGEYSVMYDAMGLYMPLKKYTGDLSFNASRLAQHAVEASNAQLRQYAKYLQGLIGHTPGFRFDLASFVADVQQGLVFDADIPQGFGLGSSGALCAALYNRYALEKIPQTVDFTSTSILQLKAIFSQMEAYFHGKSSGFDPLICYLNQPFLVKDPTVIQPVNFERERTQSKYVMFLLNTGKAAITQPYVKFFLAQCKKSTFFHKVKNTLIPTSDRCIRAFLRGDIDAFFSGLQELSNYIIAHLRQMVPKKFIDLWHQGLESQCYYLKLCGSGGGGFLLGFTDQFEKTKALLSGHQLTVVQTF